MAQRRGLHACCAGLPERDGAGVQSRAGGEDVVDDDIARERVDGHPIGEDESPGDILTAFLPAEAGLRDCLVLFAQEEFRSAAGDVRRQEDSDAFGLIIATVELAGSVQRDRDEDRAGEVTSEDLVGQGRMGEVVGQKGAPFVFDAMDDPSGGSAGAEGADRPGEGRPEVQAVRAGSVAFEDTFEGMAAGQAPRVVDAGELVGTGGREVRPVLVVHRLLRDGAIPREDQVEEPAVEVSQPPHRVRLAASGVCGPAPRRSRRRRWR